jgi:hypothetical protein
LEGFEVKFLISAARRHTSGTLSIALVAALAVAGGLAVATRAGGDTGRGAGLGLGAGTFDLTSRQAREVEVVMRFVDDLNHARMKPALHAFADSTATGLSDCNFRTRRIVEVRFRSGIRRWLSARFADHDQLEVSRVSALVATQPLGNATVPYSRRSSRELRALGFPRGIRPILSTKVSFTPAGPVQIVTFGNGGDPTSCRPRATG